MAKIPIPVNEKERLKALKETEILDTANEDLFDNITHLASYICKTPIALITLVDKNRQWFKSRVGLEFQETSRDISFCAHAITNPDDVFIVNDALKDERFANNPLVTSDPKIRFYAGLPLITREGYGLGTLCVIDHQPRNLTEEEISVLRTLRNTVINEIELRRTIKELNKVIREKDIIKQELVKIKETLESTVNNQSDKLYAANKTLQMEIQEHLSAERELKLAREKMKQISKMKTDFLSQISHEIRTPLHTILSYISLVEEALGKMEDENIYFFFQAIERGSKRLIRTTDLILTMSQIQSGNYDIIIKEYDITETILLPLIKELKIQAEKKNLKLEYIQKTKDTIIHCDKNTIDQVFNHLIGNAITYTEEGQIAVSVFRDDQSKLNVSVADTGIGMSPEFLGDLFTPFSQEETGYTRRYEGVGLGLALVKRFCQLNNASINVESVKAKGSTFTVKFD